MRPGRLSDRLNTFGLIAAALGCAALFVLAAQAHAAPKLDYGDAPDGASAGYEIAVTGHFPSLRASNGPRHRGSGPSLGIRRDTEPNSKQVDRDRFDDGVSLGQVGVCKTSRITVLIDTRRIPAKLLRKKDLYLNSWFDWNRSGTWGEANGCPGVNPLLNNEWAIVNQRIAGKAFLKERVRAFSFRFAGGLHSQEFWTRVTLTLGQKLPIDAASRSGGASSSPYAYGETEDYLVRAHGSPPPVYPDPSGKGGKKREEEEKKRKEEKKKQKEEEERGEGGPFKVSCVPNTLIIAHGRAGVVRLFVKDEGKGLIFGKQLTPRSGNSYKSRILHDPNQNGVPPGYFRGSGFRVKSTKRDARKNPIELRYFQFLFQRGKTKQLLRCLVVIVHEKPVEPKKPHKPAKVPPAAPPQQPQPQPGPTGGEGQTPLNGQGFYQPTSNAAKFGVGVQFDQDVEGFRIHLKSGPPPEFAEVENVAPGIECKVSPDHLSILCTGNLKAAQAAGLEVLINPAPPNAAALEGQLEVFGIQGGAEKGPFPVKMK